MAGAVQGPCLGSVPRWLWVCFVKEVMDSCHSGSSTEKSATLNICSHNKHHSVPRDIFTVLSLCYRGYLPPNALNVYGLYPCQCQRRSPSQREENWLTEELKYKKRWINLPGNPLLEISHRLLECGQFLHNKVALPSPAKHLFFCFFLGSNSWSQG